MFTKDKTYLQKQNMELKIKVESLEAKVYFSFYNNLIFTIRIIKIFKMYQSLEIKMINH